ncbi:hypothetical protein K493DRAFT_308962 [Basidiobolus meristosporus CBS 931.73]|uniref:Uncharacterized protein n=1 Tax=Basidiobolus meristosporus CBS 931.73 TaxID=1314790 RepID=A0A1Y1WUE7_9FUNG|nr:hypothetical protein K493DRAFT_308962 [Basidiobolus meristosporus CBS 931.73]|eukprot:ORX77025.1 hypothetical protein K493DRAFT_308962 [Basidiobolus meristosporus CBS 931.73]
MRQAQISDRNPQSGLVVKKFSSNREEEAQNTRHYIDVILSQMSRNTLDQTLWSNQGVEEEQGNPEEAQLGGRYGGGADTGDEKVMEGVGDMGVTGDTEDAIYSIQLHHEYS